MEKLSSYLSELASKAKTLEENTADFQKGLKKEQGDWLETTKAHAKNQKKAFSEKVKSLQGDTQSFWKRVKKNHNKAVKKGKTALNEFKDDIKVKNASLYAKVAEEDAEASILFALHAMAAAERSVIEALEARAKADQLK